MSEDIQHYLALIDDTTKRLKVLERQRAQLGSATPPHITNEIAQCEKDIQVYTARLDVGAPPSDRARNSVPGDPDILIIQWRQRQLEDVVKDALTTLQAQQTAMQAQIGYNNEEAVRWRAEERTQRKTGQQRNEDRLEKLESGMATVRAWQENVATMGRRAINTIGVIVLIIIVASVAFYLGAHR